MSIGSLQLRLIGIGAVYEAVEIIKTDIDKGVVISEGDRVYEYMSGEFHDIETTDWWRNQVIAPRGERR